MRVNSNVYYILILETGKQKRKNLCNILHNNLARTHYERLEKENSPDKYCVKFQDISRIFYKDSKSQDFPGPFKFQYFLGPVRTQSIEPLVKKNCSQK